MRKNKFRCVLISCLKEYEDLAKRHSVPVEEVMQIDLNRCGVFLRDEKIRENFRTRFKARLFNEQESWFALPVMSSEDTNFSIVGEELFCFDKKLVR